jgi:hypothetical protein
LIGVSEILILWDGLAFKSLFSFINPSSAMFKVLLSKIGSIEN